METATTRPDELGFFLKNYLFSVLILAVCIMIFVADLTGIVRLGDWVGLGALLAGILLIAVSRLHTKLHCQATSIRATEDVLIYETGVVHHHRKKIPVHMITDTSINRPLFDRLIGVSTLNISTSGSTGYEVVLPCLPWKEAKEFHTELFKIISALRKPPPHHKEPRTYLTHH